MRTTEKEIFVCEEGVHLLFFFVFIRCGLQRRRSCSVLRRGSLDCPAPTSIRFPFFFPPPPDFPPRFLSTALHHTHTHTHTQKLQTIDTGAGSLKNVIEFSDEGFLKVLICVSICVSICVLIYVLIYVFICMQGIHTCLNVCAHVC
jgi:hypothetical protein